MKFSAKTVTMLKNFASINQSIVIKEGNVLSTISSNKTIMAKSIVPDTFERKFAIYNLGRFISSISLMENPDLDFGDNSVVIKSNGHAITYHYADPSIILTPPDKEIKLPSVDVECKILNQDLQGISKALGVLGLPELAIAGDGTKITLQAVDSKNPSADTYNIEIGDTDKIFRAIFKSENLKMIEGDYQVKLSAKGISQFIGLESTYFIAIEATSTFNG